MKKILLLVLFIFLITGCKVEYNLVINNDLSVSESVIMTGTDEFFDSFYKSSRINVVEMFLDEGRRDDLKKSGYEYNIVEDETPYVVATKNYNSMEEFVDKTIFKEQYFEDLEIIKEENIVTLKNKEFIPISPDSIERYGIKITTLKITLPYEVVESNASLYDDLSNTYIWYISDGNEDFSLVLSYDINKIYEGPKDNNSLLLILASLVFVIGVIVATYIMNKKNK